MPIGFMLARVVADEAEILTLGVLAEARRYGVGRRLLESACARARTLGARRIYLEVGAGNTAGLALYRQLGFTETGRRDGYYDRGDDAREDAVLMVKAL